jgi:hypothetical protein
MARCFSQNLRPLLSEIIFEAFIKGLEYLKKPVKIDYKSLSNSSWAF